MGNQVEKINLYDKTVHFCKGCLVCQTTKKCIIHDDVAVILQKMSRADAIVFATPIYFYEMCGQMKTFLDRTNPLFPADYAFRDVYLLATAADEAESAAEGALHGLQGWLDCFEKTRLAGIVFGGNVTAIGEINGHIALHKAYEMGKSV